MQQTGSDQNVDIDALKAQVDAEIAARLLLEADYARFVHRRGFCIADMNLLVPLDAASEVTEMPPLFRLPGAPPGVKGLANRHGRVVPVLDLPAIFGRAHEWEAHTWLLVYGHGDEAIGLIIETLPERKMFAPTDAADPAQIEHPIAVYARAAYREGNDLWIEPDMEGLFAAVFNVGTSSA